MLFMIHWCGLVQFMWWMLKLLYYNNSWTHAGFFIDGSSYWSITTDGGQHCMHVCCHYSSVEQPQGVLNSRDLWIWNRFNSVRPGGICTSPLPTQLQEGNPQQSGHFRCYLSSTSKGFHLVLTSVSMMPSSFEVYVNFLLEAGIHAWKTICVCARACMCECMNVIYVHKCVTML